VTGAVKSNRGKVGLQICAFVMSFEPDISDKKAQFMTVFSISPYSSKINVSTKSTATTCLATEANCFVNRPIPALLIPIFVEHQNDTLQICAFVIST
jgi:hypothetical protein